MKKHYFFVISLLVFNVTIFAQETRFGVKAGLNVSNIHENDSPYGGDSKYRSSFHAGFFAKLTLSSTFYFQPELLYSSIGDINEYNLNSFDRELVFSDSFKQVVKYNYLVIPLTFKWYVGERFFINAGPQIGFLLNTVGKNKGDNLSESFNEIYKSSGDFKLDYGAVLGLGYTINDDVEIGLQYYTGLKNLYNDSFIDGLKAHHTVFQLSASYAIF